MMRAADTALSRTERYVTEPPVNLPALSIADRVGCEEHRPAGWYSAVIVRLQDIAMWPSNWDGYDARRVSMKALEFAISVLKSSMWQGTPEPFVSATTVGGVAIQWRTPTLELLVEGTYEGHGSSLIVHLEQGLEWEGPLGDEPDGLEKWAFRLADR